MHTNSTNLPRLGLLQSFVPDFSRMAAPIPKSGIDYLSSKAKPKGDGDDKMAYPFPSPPDLDLARGLLSGWLEEDVAP